MILNIYSRVLPVSEMQGPIVTLSSFIYIVLMLILTYVATMAWAGWVISVLFFRHVVWLEKKTLYCLYRVTSITIQLTLLVNHITSQYQCQATVITIERTKLDTHNLVC